MTYDLHLIIRPILDIKPTLDISSLSIYLFISKPMSLGVKELRLFLLNQTYFYVNGSISLEIVALPY